MLLCAQQLYQYFVSPATKAKVTMHIGFVNLCMKVATEQLIPILPIS